MTAAMLETERLTLRRLGPEDATEEYAGWLNDPAVNRFLEVRFARHTVETVRDFIRSCNDRPGEFLLGMFLKADGRHIGNIKLGAPRPNHALADIGLVIGARDCWGSGYATEAIARLTRFAFEDLGLLKLEAGAYAGNEGSARAFLKAGWRQEGLRRGHLLLDGRPCDLIELGLCADEFRGAAP